MYGRNISSKNFMTEGNKQLSRSLRKRAEKEIAAIDFLYRNAKNRCYNKKIVIGKETWIEYTHVSDTMQRVLIHTPDGDKYLDPVNGLANGSRHFITKDNEFSVFYDRDEGLIFPSVVATSVIPWIYYSPTSYVGEIMKMPGKYTGEMRKVIQALISVGEYLPYEYKAAKCHGVYTATNDSKWIIQISSEGVYAARMPLLVIDENKEHHLDWLGYHPAGRTDDISLWTDYVRIAGPSVVTDYYSKNPIYSACGWAFNSTGNAAQNCAVIPGTGGSAGSPSYGYRYKITISEVFNAPVSATMVLEESGSFAMDRKRGIKYPSEDETHLELYINQDGRETLGNSYSAPRYVFYDGDQEIVVRSKSSSGDAIGSNGTISPDGIPSPKHTWSNPGIPFTQADSISLNTDSVGSYFITATANGIKTGTVVDGHLLGHNISSSVLECTISESWQKNHCWSDSVFNNRYHPANQHFNHSVYRVTGITHLSSVVIPINDRESVFQYHWEGGGGGDKFIANVASAGSGTYDYTSCGFDEDLGVTKYILTKTSEHDGNSFHAGDALRRYLPRAPDSPCEGYSNVVPEDGYGASTTDGSTPGDYLSELHIISSGGINEQLWTDDSYIYPDSAYNNDTDPSNPQWMHVHRDNTFELKTICSKIMNAIKGSQMFTLGIDEVKYPISELSSCAINTFWVGDPHCVNNDCEE